MLTIKCKDGNPNTVEFSDKEGKKLDILPSTIDVKFRPGEIVTVSMGIAVKDFDVDIFPDGVAVYVCNWDEDRELSDAPIKNQEEDTMAKTEFTAKVDTEVSLHRAIHDLVQDYYDRGGIKINRINADWIDTVGVESCLIRVEVETETRVR